MKNKYKYSAIVEGETEKRIFEKLKNNIIKANKLTLCKEHNFKNNNGTININKIKNLKCCTQIVIMDQDNIKNLNDYYNKKSESNLLIVSKPSIEIVLYALCDVCESNINKKEIEEKLRKCLKNKFKINYKHGPEPIKDIFYLLEDENQFQKWKSNLKKLKEQNKSNFIELIEYMEEYKNNGNL